MPKKNEIDELQRECTWTWVAGKGYSVLGPNGNSIFLPAAGNRCDTWLDGCGNIGYYWSSTPIVDGKSTSVGFFFRNDKLILDWDYRYYGFTVRPVRD